MKRYLFIFLVALLSACQKEAGEKVPDNVFYTCSMDPQIMEKKPGTCPICKMDLTKVVIDKNNQSGLKISKEQEELANIKTMIVSEGTLGTKKTVNGRVVINENKVLKISSRVPGRIEKLYVKNTGESIYVGMLLYDLYSEELLAAQKEYLIALERSKQSSGLDLDYNRLIEGAKNKLLLWGMSEKQISELSSSKTFRNTTPIYSKQNGVITAVNSREGNYVMDGEAVFEVADLSTMWVEAEIYASEVTEFSNDDLVNIQIDGFPDKTWKSHISFAAPQLQTQSKINLIRAEIPNPNNLLKPGMQAIVFLKGKTRETIALPINSVLQDSKGASVWIRKKDGSYESRMVVTGIESGDLIEIRAGLEAGDEVVISGAYLLNSEYIFKKGSNPMEGHNM